jgi:hypothetical protein
MEATSATQRVTHSVSRAVPADMGAVRELATLAGATLKSQMFGRAGLTLLRKRVLLTARN